MNKKNNRKGFTTVELVIVIAVIAILATVLIPTFSNLINKANESAAMQEARNAYNSYVIEYPETATKTTVHIKADSFYFTATNGQFDADSVTTSEPESGLVIEYDAAAPYGFKCVTTTGKGHGEAGTCETCGTVKSAT